MKPLLVALLLASQLLPAAAAAHSFDPGLLVLRELGTHTDSGRWAVRWQEPPLASREGLTLFPHFPEHCRSERRQGAWLLDCGPGPLRGPVAVAGLEAAQAEVVLRLRPLGGEEGIHVLRPGAVSWEDRSVEDGPVSSFAGEGGLGGWLFVGMEHFLFGWDHIAFVLGLCLLIASLRALIVAITAFTIAHSISLALSVSGWVTLPSAPVEAIIALSVVYLARELLRPESGGLSQRAPWAVAFLFGLVHGLGFAGALAELGLPQGGVLFALLGFNLGLEFGQLLFLGLIWLPARRWREDRLPMRPLLPYALGTVAMVWTLERVSLAWSAPF